jgi:outer membrane receptor protein involved in Fe transport
MNTPLQPSAFFDRCCPRPLAVFASLVATATLLAQAVAPAPTSSTVKTADTAITMSPFEVNTSKDTSYGALNSTSITAFNMQLLKTPVAADIFTEEFMRDVAATTVEDLLNGYGAGVGQVFPTPDTNANDNQPGDRVGIGPIGSRGVAGSFTRRNGFVASATSANYTDMFDMERVEMIKGANALLYGSSGAGGVVNTSSKMARFGSDRQPLITTTFSSRNDQFGSRRWMLDANYGLSNLAYRFVFLNEDLSYRRLFIGAKTTAFYGTIAARLPFNSTVRLTGRRTDNNRLNNTNTGDLGFTNATRDPRHNFALQYLLATGQAGATNPKTGAPYPAGAIANGRLSWDNASSWGGWAQNEDVDGENFTLTVDSNPTPWLAVSFGVMYDRSVSQRGVGVTALLAPRTFNTANPYDDWANGSNFAMNRNNDANAGRRVAYRGSAVVSNEFFRGRAKSQTVLGYDLSFGPGVNGGQVNYRYYEADANFRLYDRTNPRPVELGGTTGADALGRVAMGTVYWPVGNGPVKKPFFKPGSRRISNGGRNYVLEIQNPRNPDWVSPLNPLGLLTLVPGYASIGGANLGDYADTSKNSGIYVANYTRWFDDRLASLVGVRYSKSFTRSPNTVTTGTQAWNDAERQSNSYNLGLNYRVKSWLYAYYNAGRTFSPPVRPGDFFGNPPKDTIGLSQEIGFKYEPAGARLSGSISYYVANSQNETFNSYSSYANVVNPVGLNGGFNPALRNVWVNLDKESRGLEIILTAAPTRNWRARLGFTQQNGTIRTPAAYPILWNDEFHYNKSTGGVTYSNGTPFLVPTDPAGLTLLNTTSTLRDPIAGTSPTQLTIAMMNDRTNPYYAYGQGGTTTVNGQLPTNSLVYRALRYFQIPSGSEFLQARTLRTGLPITDIPYTFSDPAGYQGVVVLATSGEPTVGHPLYRFVLTNTYDFREGRLRGVTLGGTVRWDLAKRTYWYTEPTGTGGNTRSLYREVSVNPQVSPFLAYSRKLGRYLYRGQLNVNNLFNHYKVEIRPSGTLGYTVENALFATFVGEPRQYVWTNTISF